MSISQHLDPPDKMLNLLKEAWTQGLLHSISVLPPMSSTSMGNLNTTFVIVNFTKTTPLKSKQLLLSHIQQKYDIMHVNISTDEETLYITYE